ncbi:MAG TPA: protein-glutamate O-methyltransferase CheR [Gemmatimonadaceae bacterium]|nr:protein-glutamate O-methyltransferase CheR [Gemmatimonadaceae bacterium]
MTANSQDDEFSALTQKIARERGFGCASYKDKCVRRRIAVRMRARGLESYRAYANLLDDDAGEYDRLIDTLTINVTKFFRNWDVWEVLAAIVVPNLWRRAVPSIRVWSAGCSSGEEAYSIAILFHRYATAVQMLDQIGRVHIVGTDIDRSSLDAATRARYEVGAFADTPQDLRGQYFEPAAPLSPARSIRALVRFDRRDLLSEAAPASQHLILCRNVLIYFDRETQERLFDKFCDALAPDGVLVLGKVETLLGQARNRFAPIDVRARIYQKI